MEGERGGREGGWREKGKWTRKEGRNSRKGRNGKREGITLTTCTPIPLTLFTHLTLFTLHPLTPSPYHPYPIHNEKLHHLPVATCRGKVESAFVLETTSIGTDRRC